MPAKRPKSKWNCLPTGEYDAEITSVEKTQRKKDGSDMAAITLAVYHNDKRYFVRDWIGNWNKKWRIEQLANSLGKQTEYTFNTFRLYEAAGGWVRLRVNLTEDKEWGWQNKVESYLETGHGDDAKAERMPNGPEVVETQKGEEWCPF